MSSRLLTADPLALVAIQAGLIGPPSNEAAAAGSSQLDSPQRSVVIGEPVPIVFCRRRNGAGGVLISPGATECRFENDTNNNVTAFYHLVLSEGRLDSIQVRDVFQRSCRVGTYSQTYDRRAGTWQPGNFIVKPTDFKTPEASYYCGSVGTYTGMSTLSFRVTVSNGLDYWNRQVHAFIRGGMWVTRLIDGVTGPSDNFADLTRWMLTKSGVQHDSLIDDAALLQAATFLEVNGFTCNCKIVESQNYTDLLARWAPGFLLCESNRNGKRGLRPLLPVTASGEIRTDAILPVFTFTEDNITPNTFEVSYTSLAQRRPVIVQVIWRQQPDDDFGIIRTAEVRYSGTPSTGPFESHDLSEVCTTENHAVKVGAYILAKRRHSTHNVRFTTRPQANNTTVRVGDIVRVRLARRASAAGAGSHDLLYQVERITKTLSGELSYEASHFPVDSQGRSIIALAVSSAVGTGILLSSNKTGLGCDVNSSTDTTVPGETFTPAEPLPPVDIGGGGSTDSGGGGGGGGDISNPTDGLDEGDVPVVEPVFRNPDGTITKNPTPESTIDPYNPCGNGQEPVRLYYYGDEVRGATENVIVGKIIGEMRLSTPGSKEFRVVYSCPAMDGSNKITAVSTPVNLAQNPNSGEVVAELISVKIGRPDGTMMSWTADQWVGTPVTKETEDYVAFAWGGVNGRVTMGSITKAVRYSGGAIVNYST